jgi:hypothetical protein
MVVCHSPSNTFSLDDLVDAVHRARSERRHSRLHSNFDGFKRTETNVSEELSRSGTSEIDPSLVLDRSLGSSQIGVELFEELVASVFERALNAVAEESGRATGVDATDAVCFDDLTPAVQVASVELCIDLTTTFDEIERCHGPVRPQAMRPPKVHAFET